LQALYDKGQSVSVLMPIDYRLYRTYGFEHCYDLQEYHIQISNLSGFKKRGAFVRASNEDGQKLVDVYKQFLVTKQGYLIRDEEYYKLYLKEVECEDGYVYIYYDGDNIPKGYISYYFQEQNLFVREMFYLDKSVLEAMLCYIYEHNTQVGKLILHTPMQDVIHFVLPNLRDGEIKIKPFMMARVINVKKFINSIQVAMEQRGNFILRVKDSWLKENEKNYEIFFDSGKMQIVDTDKTPDIVMHIDTFTQIAFGRVSVEEAYLLNRLEVQKAEALEWLRMIFPTTVNYINEYV